MLCKRAGEIFHSLRFRDLIFLFQPIRNTVVCSSRSRDFFLERTTTGTRYPVLLLRGNEWEVIASPGAPKKCPVDVMMVGGSGSPGAHETAGRRARNSTVLPAARAARPVHKTRRRGEASLEGEARRGRLERAERRRGRAGWLVFRRCSALLALPCLLSSCPFAFFTLLFTVPRDHFFLSPTHPDTKMGQKKKSMGHHRYANYGLWARETGALAAAPRRPRRT